VHAVVRELLDHANAYQTWGVEVAAAFVDLIATRLSVTYAALDPLSVPKSCSCGNRGIAETPPHAAIRS
jgi:hypothetical protein